MVANLYSPPRWLNQIIIWCNLGQPKQIAKLEKMLITIVTLHSNDKKNEIKNNKTVL